MSACGSEPVVVVRTPRRRLCTHSGQTKSAIKVVARNQHAEVKPMTFWIASAIGLVIDYLLGSTPTGYLAGKLLKGIDIREHGCKSTGATNVLRTLGKWPALLVLVADVLKGVAAIIVARSFCPWLYAELSTTPPTAFDLQLL